MWWGCRDVVPVGRRRIRVALAGRWGVGRGWDWRWSCYGSGAAGDWPEVGQGRRRKCDAGIGSGSKRRIGLPAIM